MTTATASSSGDAIISRKSWKANLAPKCWRASSALSGLVVQTAVSSTSGLAISAGKCDWADQVEVTLAPTNPKRILSVTIHAPLSRGILPDSRDGSATRQSFLKPVPQPLPGVDLNSAHRLAREESVMGKGLGKNSTVENFGAGSGKYSPSLTR